MIYENDLIINKLMMCLMFYFRNFMMNKEIIKSIKTNITLKQL